MWITLKIFNFLTCFFNLFFIKKYLHIYQLKDYNNARYVSFFSKRKFAFLLLNLLLIITLNLITNFIAKLILTIITILSNFIFNLHLIKQNKTPIKFTNKLKRLYLISCVLLVFTVFLAKFLLISQILMVFSPVFANFLNFYDKIKNFCFIKSAQKKLNNSKAKVIAITGSNGKTSVKNILLEILKTQYKIQATPSSYNTPLGISKFINQELKNNCEFVILEYGARHKNDIKKLCKIFGADYGIVTTISPQHLQTFKTIENIKKAKNELPKFLKKNLCIFNIDNNFCKHMFQEKIGDKKAISILSESDIFATDICVENFQTKFKIHTKNFCTKLSTNLLGKHNVTNILLATALAIELNVKIENIVDAIAELTPTPHRLEFIKSHINILDDSYNCSLASATEAINILSSTKHKKIIVTPGIIEGGKEQFQLNFKLGKMCKNLDYVIIIGETNKKAILSGIKSQNFKCKIFTCKSLEESKQHFNLLNQNDCLLLLNDLPDDYN